MLYEVITHDINGYLGMLGLDGELTLVGAPETPLKVSAFALLFGRKRLSGSLIGGIKETQEMLDFCGNHNITSDVEVIPIQQVSIDINDAEAMLKAADFPSMIAEAERNADFRVCVRLYYLWLLRFMKDREIIVWEPEKTNAEYFRITSYNVCYTKLLRRISRRSSSAIQIRT